MQKSERVEYFIIKKCLNNCIFCSERDRFDGSEVHFKEIKRVLIRERKKGCQIVHFMGGEPTMHSRFREILIFAKTLGFLTHIITNGIKFSSIGFCKKTLPLLDEIMVSVHGHNTGLHNIHTRNRESFRSAKKGLSNINKYFKGRLCATSTITNLNLDYLDRIADFFSRYKKIREIQYIAIIPSGEGGRNFIKTTPRLRDLKKAVPRIARVCQERKINLRFAGVPMCILGRYYVLSHDLWEDFKIDNIETHNDKLLLWKEPKYSGRGEDFEIDIGRIKTKKCARCNFKDICGGIYKKYYQEYGDHELQPFK
jgi:radical SAM protein with 4Fe4S-binding SPASM domain